MVNYFPDYGCLLGMIRFDFTMIALSPQSCCGFFSVLGCRVSFLVSCCYQEDYARPVKSTAFPVNVLVFHITQADQGEAIET